MDPILGFSVDSPGTVRYCDEMLSENRMKGILSTTQGKQPGATSQGGPFFSFFSFFSTDPPG